MRIAVIAPCVGVLIAWAICHVWFCVQVLTFKPPSEAHFSWLIAFNLVVLLYALIGIKLGDFERQRSLLGGFILGITPLGLTGLAFVTASPLLPQFLNGSGGELNLASLDASLVRKHEGRPVEDRTLLVGLDVSESVLSRRQATSGTAGKICDALRYMFLRNPEPPSPVPDDPEIWVRGFAADHRLIVHQGRSLGEVSRNEALDIVCAEMQREQKNADANDGHTNIGSFIDDMLGPIEELLKEQRHLAFVLVSDFMQDTGLSSSDGELQRFQRITSKLREINRRSVTGGSDPLLTIVGIKVVPERVPETGAMGRDVLPDLRNGLGPLWREVQLEDLVADRVELERVLLLSSLIAPERPVPVANALSIHYSHGIGLPHVSAIRLPLADPDFSIVGLRLSGGHDGEPVPDISIEVLSGDGFDANRTVIRTSDPQGRWGVQRFEGPSSGLLLFRLLSKMEDVGTVQVNLTLSIPKKPINYVVPVVITPVAEPFAQRAFALLVLFFAASVLFLASIEVWRLGGIAWKSIPGRNPA